jgi:hypothetical protein
MLDLEQTSNLSLSTFVENTCVIILKDLKKVFVELGCFTALVEQLNKT